MASNAQLAITAQRVSRALADNMAWHQAECTPMRLHFLNAVDAANTYGVTDAQIIAAWRWWRDGWHSASHPEKAP